MAITAGPALCQSKVNHCPEQKGRCERIFARERLGRRRQDLVMIAVQLFGSFRPPAARLCPTQPGDEKRDAVSKLPYPSA